ncbi:hypothetical protein [Paenibacillus sp. LS1]|uniref:hypothetical protein n=1 Tax=Paenibacillus sp. LS1 TaxID=2992120 RepID=UPI002231566A|nr:hypothetical protein [Paenibacillus sp. LS1]
MKPDENNIVLDYQSHGRCNPSDLNNGSIPMEYVIDSTGNLIPFEKVRERVEISEEHYLTISNLMSLLDKKSILEILDENKA